MVCRGSDSEGGVSTGLETRDRVNTSSSHNTVQYSHDLAVVLNQSTCDSVNIDKLTEMGETCTINHRSKATCRCPLCTYCYFMSGSG